MAQPVGKLEFYKDGQLLQKNTRDLLLGDVLKIGRAKSSHIQLLEGGTSVSRNHCILRVNSWEDWQLEDFSTNGSEISCPGNAEGSFPRKIKRETVQLPMEPNFDVMLGVVKMKVTRKLPPEESGSGSDEDFGTERPWGGPHNTEEEGRFSEAKLSPCRSPRTDPVSASPFNSTTLPSLQRLFHDRYGYFERPDGDANSSSDLQYNASPEHVDSRHAGVVPIDPGTNGKRIKPTALLTHDGSLEEDRDVRQESQNPAVWKGCNESDSKVKSAPRNLDEKSEQAVSSVVPAAVDEEEHESAGKEDTEWQGEVSKSDPKSATEERGKKEKTKKRKREDADEASNKKRRPEGKPETNGAANEIEPPEQLRSTRVAHEVWKAPEGKMHRAEESIPDGFAMSELDTRIGTCQSDERPSSVKLRDQSVQNWPGPTRLEGRHTPLSMQVGVWSYERVRPLRESGYWNEEKLYKKMRRLERRRRVLREQEAIHTRSVSTSPVPVANKIWDERRFKEEVKRIVEENIRRFQPTLFSHPKKCEYHIQQICRALYKFFPDSALGDRGHREIREYVKCYFEE